jgi:hypothetical protein
MRIWLSSTRFSLAAKTPCERLSVYVETPSTRDQERAYLIAPKQGNDG